MDGNKGNNNKQKEIHGYEHRRVHLLASDTQQQLLDSPEQSLISSDSSRLQQHGGVDLQPITRHVCGL